MTVGMWYGLSFDQLHYWLLSIRADIKSKKSSTCVGGYQQCQHGALPDASVCRPNGSFTQK